MSVRPLIVCAVVLASAVGCSSSDRDSTASPAYRVRAAGCGPVESVGSAIAVRDDLVVTVAHTVAGATEVLLEDAIGEVYRADVVAIDARSDLAVLRAPIDGRVLELSPLGSGDDGVVLGFGLDADLRAEDFTVTRRIAVTIEDIYLEEKVERDAVELETTIGHGDSGAGVVATDGTLGGIIYATSRAREDRAFAVAASEVETILATVGDGPIDPGRCV